MESHLPPANPPPIRPLPGWRVPLFAMLVSLVTAVACTVVSFVLAGPHLAEISRILSTSGGQVDPDALVAPIRSMLTPAMFLVGSAAALAGAAFLGSGLWLVIVMIIRAVRR